MSNKRQTYVKRKDNLIVFSQLPEGHKFFAILSGSVYTFKKHGNSGLHIPAEDGPDKGLIPFSHTEYVGLTLTAARAG